MISIVRVTRELGEDLCNFNEVEVELQTTSICEEGDTSFK